MHRDQSLSARDNLECCPLASLKKKRGAPLDPGVALPFSNGALPFEHWSGRGSSRPGWRCTHSPEEEEDVEEEDVDDLGQRDNGQDGCRHHAKVGEKDEATVGERGREGDRGEGKGV